MDQNTFTISKEKMKIGSFMYSIFQKMNPAFNSKGVRLKLVCTINAVVDIDPIRFEQVL